MIFSILAVRLLARSRNPASLFRRRPEPPFPHSVELSAGPWRGFYMWYTPSVVRMREAARLEARWQEKLRNAEDRRERARAFASRLAAVFGAADPYLRAVIGFGSTFEAGRGYRIDSDIDLALCGGDWGRLWSLIPQSEFSVSLVELDLQPLAFAEQVRGGGVVLYEK